MKRLLTALAACATVNLAGQITSDPFIDAARKAASAFTDSLPGTS